jgi:hypothetical protein
MYRSEVRRMIPIGNGQVYMASRYAFLASAIASLALVISSTLLSSPFTLS